MCVCDLLKSAMSWLKTFSVLGSSPPPRQQNHLSVTGGPLKLGAGSGLAAAADCEAWVDAPAADGEGDALPLHALNTSANTATIAAHRIGRFMLSSLPGGIDSMRTCGIDRSSKTCGSAGQLELMEAGPVADGRRVDAELGPVAPDKGLAVLDGLVARRERDPDEQQGQPGRRLPEKTRLPGPQQDRFDRLAGPNHRGPVAARHQPV